MGDTIWSQTIFLSSESPHFCRLERWHSQASSYGGGPGGHFPLGLLYLHPQGHLCLHPAPCWGGVLPQGSPLVKGPDTTRHLPSPLSEAWVVTFPLSMWLGRLLPGSGWPTRGGGRERSFCSTMPTAEPLPQVGPLGQEAKLAVPSPRPALPNLGHPPWAWRGKMLRLRWASRSVPAFVCPAKWGNDSPTSLGYAALVI